MATFSSLRSSIKGFKGNNRHLVWKGRVNTCNISYIHNNEIITRTYYSKDNMLADLTEYYNSGFVPPVCFKIYKNNGIASISILEFYTYDKEIPMLFLQAFRDQQDRSVGMSQIPFRKDIESVCKFYNSSEDRII